MARAQGTSWRFRAFYTLFRKGLSEQLGFGNYEQLSLYSPMISKRSLLPSQQQPSAWCACAARARARMRP